MGSWLEARFAEHQGLVQEGQPGCFSFPPEGFDEFPCPAVANGVYALSMVHGVPYTERACPEQCA